MTRRNIWLGLATLTIFTGLFYFYGGHQTAAGQAPLADLNTANLGEFKKEFNGSQANVRMLVLLLRLDQSACGGPPHSNRYSKHKQSRICAYS